MKKTYYIFALICLFMLTGCTKNYKTVQEYSDDMTALRTNLGDYTIEATINKDGNENYVKSYINNPKWKTEISKDGGKTYQEGILYDGDEVYSFSKKQNMAISIPFKQLLAKQENIDAKSTDMIMKYINPAGFLYDWSVSSTNLDDELTFGKNNVVKNEFKCRMIQSKKDSGEICVNDKYGIAVYAKLKDNRKGDYIELNVKKVENTKLTYDEIGLPNGIKKLSMADLFQNMAKMMNPSEF